MDFEKRSEGIEHKHSQVIKPAKDEFFLTSDYSSRIKEEKQSSIRSQL